MKIALLAPFKNHAFGLVCEFGFRSLGHEVHRIDFKELSVNKTMLQKIQNKFIKGHNLIRANQELFDAVKRIRPELVFVLKGDLIFPDTLLRIKKEIGSKLIVWHNDNPYNVLCSSSHLIYSTSIYDTVFVCDPYFIPEIKRLGARRVFYLPPCSDPALFEPVDLSEQDRGTYKSPLTFVGGSEFYNSYRRIVLKDVVDLGLTIWGDYWRPQPYNPVGRTHAYWGDSYDEALVACCRTPAYGAALIKAYRCSKIGVNVLPDQLVEGLNLRTFEIPACGTFMLTQESKMLGQEFKIGEEVVAFKSSQDLRKKAIYYLKNDKERDQIAANGRKRCEQSHSAVVRMGQVLNAL